ncbi:MAG: hypothetical protein MJ072_06375, partial [Clostridia bacterium]|nr:hypothetical protein [Clostridia bacterium]
QFFPFANYEMQILSLNGKTGFRFFGKDWTATALFVVDENGSRIEFEAGEQKESVEDKDFLEGDRFLVTISGNNFIYYLERDNKFLLQGM